jgi:hypothetical protein
MLQFSVYQQELAQIPGAQNARVYQERPFYWVNVRNRKVKTAKA